jgi:hypothetical protein
MNQLPILFRGLIINKIKNEATDALFKGLDSIAILSICSFILISLNELVVEGATQ